MKRTGKTSNTVKRINKTFIQERKTQNQNGEGAKKNTIDPIEGNEMSIVEKAKMILDAGPIDGNEFSRMRYEVASKIVEYDTIKKDCKIQDVARSMTIYRLAKPFIEGHFTLAVVGEASAGKSTFINTLIGDNLFPTGKDQTTSTLTFIEKGSEPKIEITFGDGRTESICGDIHEIKNRLWKHVAIPDEYSSIPVNEINHLILDNYDINTILSQKSEIERRTKRPKTDESLWRMYVNDHAKKDIAERVKVSYRLPDEFDGWRIIDTPGVGATGGAQEETKLLFEDRYDNGNKKVDAIVYLQDGTSYIEDETTHDFMEMIVNGLTEDAKKRMFFVLTKAAKENSIGMEDYMSRKEGTLQKARDLYARNFGISKERFFYIDSLLERFRNDLKDKKDFDVSPCPSNWDEDEWNGMTNLYSPIKKYLVSKGIKMANPSIDKVMKEWASFGRLMEAINKFVRVEKLKACNNIYSIIGEDYDDFFKGFELQLNLLKEGKEGIEREKSKQLKNKSEINEQLSSLTEKTAFNIDEKFSFVDKEIEEISKIEIVDAIKIAYLNLINKVVENKNNIYEELEKDFKDYWNGLDTTGQIIDFSEIRKNVEDKLDDLEQEANKENTTDPKVVRERKSFLRFIKDLFRKGELNFREEKIIGPRTDFKKARESFVEKLKQEAREKKEDYVKEINNKVKVFQNEVYNKMMDKLNNTIKELEGLDADLADKSDKMEKLDENLEKIRSKRDEFCK